MFLRLIGIFFFFIIGFVVWSLLKLIFQLGRTSGELNRKYDEIRRDKSGKGKNGNGSKGEVIELKKDQYKVE